MYYLLYLIIFWVTASELKPIYSGNYSKNSSVHLLKTGLKFYLGMLRDKFEFFCTDIIQTNRYKKFPL